MRFEKTFHQATDPVQVANQLAQDVVRLELIQLSYPCEFLTFVLYKLKFLSHYKNNTKYGL